MHKFSTIVAALLLAIGCAANATARAPTGTAPTAPVTQPAHPATSTATLACTLQGLGVATMMGMTGMPALLAPACRAAQHPAANPASSDRAAPPAPPLDWRLPGLGIGEVVAPGDGPGRALAREQPRPLHHRQTTAALPG